MTDATLLDRMAEALWSAFMEQPDIKMGKEFVSFDELTACAKNGNEKAQMYLATIHREVLAVARVLLSEPVGDDNLMPGVLAYHEWREKPVSALKCAGPVWSAMAAARLASLTGAGNG